MKKQDNILLDLENQKMNNKKSWSITLLFIGLSIICCVFLTATFWTNLGLGPKESVWLAVALMISFAINITGFIFGIAERNKGKKKAWVGITGNLILIILFILIVAYSIGQALNA